MNEIPLPNIQELNKAKFYHLNLPAEYTAEQVAYVADGLKRHGVKCFLSVGKVVIEPLIELYKQLPPDKQELVQKAMFRPELESIDMGLLSDMRSETVHIPVNQSPTIPEGNEVNPKAHELMR